MTSVPTPVVPAVPIDIRAGASKAYPPRPLFVSRLLSGRLFRGIATQNMTLAAQEFGDLVHFKVFGRHIYQINHPSLIEDFLLKDASKHVRGIVMQRAKIVLGEGLLTSEEPLHMRQRRLAQPAFLRERIAAYGEVIGQNAVAISANWQSGATIDVHEEMLELALRIVGKCLFDMDELRDIAAMENAVSSFMHFMPLSFLPFSRQIQQLPIPAMTRLRAGKRHLDELIFALIAERRANPADRGDLLSMLLNATDNTDGNSGGMTDRQLRDECVTVILAGHETTANALAFALDLLARHPEIQQRLHEESAVVLGQDSPTSAHYARLPYATQVFAETMRLYPPVWVNGRIAAESYEIAGYRVPKGASLMAPQYFVHRDPRWWSDPDTFDPERFTEANKAQRKRLTYFPFGSGSRQCIAEGLAWMEGTLALAAIVRDWKLERRPGDTGELALKPLITLRPANGVPLVLRRR